MINKFRQLPLLHFRSLMTLLISLLSLIVAYPVYASNTIQYPQATAITQVFGDGAKLTAVAINYNQPINGKILTKDSFQVLQHTINDVYTSSTTNPDDRNDDGPFVIIKISPNDTNINLAHKIELNNVQTQSSTKKGPGNAGDIPIYDTVYIEPQVNVIQLAPITTIGGDTIPANDQIIMTTRVKNLIVDDFQSLQFYDAKTDKTLRYNLYIPKDYDNSRSYPLVLFMHDAGATSDVTRTTLFQGLGAVIWASPEEQSKHKAFVLAPQYEEIIADDDSKTSSMLETTIDLINTLKQTYNIDTNRLYSTGQSGGCMMSIAMNIKYPDFFAASLLVAGQWDPMLVKPLAKQKLWIIVSQDDSKAYPGQNAIINVLKQNGAQISTATWDATWTPAQYQKAYDQIIAQHSPINYINFVPGSVIPKGESAAGASGHRNTWRVAYAIEPIRQWLFEQHK